jgi:uncharacterized protein YdbL (DUF1318 family)
MKKILLLCIVLSTSAFSIDFQTAREKGIVGELANGYIAIVEEKANDEITDIVKTINKKRKKKFKQISKKTGAGSTSVVGASVHKTIVEKLPEGAYYQNESGSWVRK